VRHCPANCFLPLAQPGADLRRLTRSRLWTTHGGRRVCSASGGKNVWRIGAKWAAPAQAQPFDRTVADAAYYTLSHIMAAFARHPARGPSSTTSPIPPPRVVNSLTTSREISSYEQKPGPRVAVTGPPRRPNRLCPCVYRIAAARCLGRATDDPASYSKLPIKSAKMPIPRRDDGVGRLPRCHGGRKCRRTPTQVILRRADIAMLVRGPVRASPAGNAGLAAASADLHAQGRLWTGGDRNVEVLVVGTRPTPRLHRDEVGAVPADRHFHRDYAARPQSRAVRTLGDADRKRCRDQQLVVWGNAQSDHLSYIPLRYPKNLRTTAPSLVNDKLGIAILSPRRGSAAPRSTSAVAVVGRHPRPMLHRSQARL